MASAAQVLGGGAGAGADVLAEAALLVTGHAGKHLLGGDAQAGGLVVELLVHAVRLMEAFHAKPPRHSLSGG